MRELTDVWDRAASATEIRVGEGEPSGEEKMIAAATYLLGFVGFWLVGALLIYFWQRKRSAFIAHHAIQSIVLQVWIMIAITIAVVVAMMGFVGTGIFGSAFLQSAWVPYLFIAGIAILFGFILLAPLYWKLSAAWGAAHGRTYHAPLVGRLADKLVASQSMGPS